MGGAVTAAPEDAMTAISNPAGMAVIGKRADFNGEAFIPKRSMDFNELPATLGGPGDETSGGSELYGIPSLGWTAPAFGRDDVYFGGGMFATAGLGVDYDVINAGAFGDADVFTSIQFWKMQPTVAWNVDEQLALGVGIDIDYQQVEIRETFSAPAFSPAAAGSIAGTPLGLPGINLDLGRAIGVYGGGITLGALYKVNDMITVGATYSSEQWFPDMKYRVASGAIFNFPDGVNLAYDASGVGAPGSGTYKLDLNFPQQAAVGIAVRPNEALTLAFDVKWVNWEDTHDEVELSGDFILDSTMTPAFDNLAANSIDLNFGWEDQWIFALGARYAVNEDLTLRAGYNYSESPIDEKDVFNNIAFPAIVEQHVTLGGTYNFGPHWAVSLSAMWALEEDLKGKGDIPQAFTNALAGLGIPNQRSSNVEIELEEYSFGAQISYRF
jgi:long-chain fatty acid transport protein